jgi:hypothetical protein
MGATTLLGKWSHFVFRPALDSNAFQKINFNPNCTSREGDAGPRI